MAQVAMGGYGSGRKADYYRWDVDDCHPLSITRFARSDLLKLGASATCCWGDNCITCTVEPGLMVRLSYRVRDRTNPDKPHQFNYPVEITTTTPHYGGSRLWWLCPRCDRRCMKLYMPPNGDKFACRHCHNLTYKVQRESRSDRNLRRNWKLRRRLGGEPGIFNDVPRPHGMHWDTYYRVTGQINEADMAAIASTTRFITAANKRLSRPSQPTHLR